MSTPTQQPAPSEEAVSLSDELKTEKLRIEILKLTSELSRQANLREWLKAATPIVGIIALAGTLWLGLRQAQQQQSSKFDEQIQSNISRLFGKEPRERLSGVAALSAVMTTGRPEYQERAFDAMINAIAAEDDAIVRGALLDALEGIDESRFGKETITSAAKRLVVRNRSLFGETADRNKPKQSAQALAIGRAVIALIKKGAKIDDLSRTFCDGCDFSQLNLRGVKFDEASVKFTNFKSADLEGASFNNAEVSGAYFTHANLRNATFIQHSFFRGGMSVSPIITYDFDMYFLDGPHFDCSTLSGADFSGFPVGTLIVDETHHKLRSDLQIGLDGADVEGANFTNVTADYARFTVAPRPKTMWGSYFGLGDQPDGVGLRSWEIPIKRELQHEFVRTLAYTRGSSKAKLPAVLSDMLSREETRSVDPNYCDQFGRWVR